MHMKVMQAYNATSNESPIPPPQAPSSTNYFASISSVFETREISHVTHLERHEEQIDAILNHLDELPLESIEHMEDKIEGLDVDKMALKRTSTSAAPSMNWAAIRKLVVDSVVAALKTQDATMANTNNTNRNTEQSGTPVAR
uniref:Uncharacterized protein n=1 Tax=Tanacetum cinerariifolium TaxID=118510 RepID=A0A6L2P0B3_TANCI|nr:hypothetical protein [Tanacetum cinerariifolium]